MKTEKSKIVGHSLFPLMTQLLSTDATFPLVGKSYNFLADLKTAFCNQLQTAEMLQTS